MQKEIAFMVDATNFEKQALENELASNAQFERTFEQFFGKNCELSGSKYGLLEVKDFEFVFVPNTVNR